MTSIFIGVKMGQVAMHGLISLNLFSECPYHSLCHFSLVNEVTANFRSELETGEFKEVHACLAALTTTTRQFKISQICFF